MSRRILIQVVTPAVFFGLLLCGVCLVAAWHVNRLQADLARTLPPSVSSMRAAQHLVLSARQLRLHCFVYLIAPDAALLREIRADQATFEEWLGEAVRVALTATEREQMATIRQGYDNYRADFERARAEVERRGPRRDFLALAQAHPIRHVTDACQEYSRTNEEMIVQLAQQSERLTQRLHLTLLLLALGGPLGGLLSGYGIARGLSRSLHRLSVRVQDVALQFDRDVAAVQLTPGGDLQQLDAQVQNVVARVTEVTQRLQRQQSDLLRTQQLAAVGQLAASVAHEVRNPLASIKMLVEAALRDHKPRPFNPDNLRIVHREVLRLERTVQGFLDFARPPALRRVCCDLRDVIAQAVELVRARAQQQQVGTEVDCPAGPTFAEVDRDQVCSVLVNLFVNALDAMPDGGHLTVRLEPSAGAGLRLSVSDTGEGIAAAMLDQLFTPFVSTRPTGSGLGLSICQRIVEAHGGSIVAVNRPGPDGGACFTLTLPARAPERNRADTAGH